MTFDMTQCKIGDKLKTRNGSDVHFSGQTNDEDYPYTISYHGKVLYYTVDKSGNFNTNFAGRCEFDIMGFCEEDVPQQEPTEEEESFPNVEPRTPYASKVVHYRLHMNELYHRDITQEEAEAIYEQLKTLLGK